MTQKLSFNILFNILVLSKRAGRSPHPLSKHIQGHRQTVTQY